MMAMNCRMMVMMVLNMLRMNLMLVNRTSRNKWRLGRLLTRIVGWGRWRRLLHAEGYRRLLAVIG